MQTVIVRFIKLLFWPGFHQILPSSSLTAYDHSTKGLIIYQFLLNYQYSKSKSSYPFQNYKKLTVYHIYYSLFLLFSHSLLPFHHHYVHHDYVLPLFRLRDPLPSCNGDSVPLFSPSFFLPPFLSLTSSDPKKCMF